MVAETNPAIRFANAVPAAGREDRLLPCRCEGGHCTNYHQYSRNRRGCPPAAQMYRRHVGRRGKIVFFGTSAKHEQCVRAADTGVARIIEHRVVDPAALQLSHPRLRSLLELPDLAEHDRFGRACCRAGRLQPCLLAVVAERALERPPVVRPAIDTAERAGDDAVAAAVAHVRLDENAAEFGTDDRSRGAGLEAPRVLAVLAHVGREVPPERVAAIPRVAGRSRCRALDELDVAPRRVTEP